MAVVFLKEVFAVEVCQKIYWFSLLNLAELVPLGFVVILVILVSQFFVILFVSAEDHVFRGRWSLCLTEISQFSNKIM